MSAWFALAAMIAGAVQPPGDCAPPHQPAIAAEEVGALRLSRHDVNGSLILRATGPIAADDAERIEAELRDGRIDQLWFDSAGGDHEEAMKLGAVLRRAGVITHIPAGATCAGACVNAFLGGAGRVIDPAGHIGIAAMPVSDEASTQSQAEREQAAGLWAERQADYYIRSGVSRGLLRLQLATPAGTTCWLTQAAQQRYNVGNSMYRTARPAPPPAQ